jgi:hypothetical protein
MANPGPASSTFGNFVIDQQNAYRLVAFAKGVNLSAAGDTLANVITSGAFVPAVIVTTNSNSTVPNVAAATVGAYTLPSQGGSTVHATAALTGQTTSTFAYVRATSVASTVVAAPQLYINVGSTVAAVGGVNATTDVLIYGYDVQT